MPIRSLGNDLLSQRTLVFQRRFLKRLLRKLDGSMTATAHYLGRSRTELYRKLRKLGIDPKVYRVKRGTDGNVEQKEVVQSVHEGSSTLQNN